ncbi:RING-type E3 ubiquitin-protein ligase PPIL2-like [Panonychus citri]|uniref:RING-type E3 ubiquitin-protein ligase PPIL2-like n=1 Tax=Panonychus citri TaxID=50023 RepID=UPI002306F448|nr:RING-type E3 ubiquitin-protein ligase PPIL2-like [Panonychus citri]
MGKRQHQKDKLYLTTTEYTYIYGGRPPDADLRQQQLNQFSRLPYDHCCLTLNPARDPYCDENGYVFDLVNIIPFLAKHKINPIDGRPMEMKNLIKLNFSKNSDGNNQCPILFKPFNSHTNIVAIKTTGNVYSRDAIEQLNLKFNNMRDLLTDEPFTKKDIITIQDPTNVQKQNAASFHHVVKKLRWSEEEDQSDPSRLFNKMDLVTKATLDELDKTGVTWKVPKSEKKVEKVADRFNRANYSTGTASQSLTSTIAVPTTRIEAATIDDTDVVYSMVKKNGYVQISTNHGPLNLELYCKDAPKSCHNFLTLCTRKYYDGTIFHRLIKNFMLQGGDPTGTGRGGESIFGEPFADEFNGHLVHQGRGVVSMANSGPNTNKSQFFITLKSCRHLDRKHSVFGKVVGGLETLNKLEKIQTDKNDRPKETIKIDNITVYVNPFQEIEDELKAERQKDKDAANKVKVKETKRYRNKCRSWLFNQLERN